MPWVELKRRVHFRHRLPAGGLCVAPGLTNDAGSKFSGGSEGPIGPAELGVVAANKNAPQRAPNKAVFKRLLILFLPSISSLR
jgi:hypothetical protein